MRDLVREWRGRKTAFWTGSREKEFGLKFETTRGGERGREREREIVPNFSYWVLTCWPLYYVEGFCMQVAAKFK